MPVVRNPSLVELRSRGTSKYVSSGSQPRSTRISRRNSFERGWWMNPGLSRPRTWAKVSTGISYCAISGSSPSNASPINDRANSQNASVAGVGEVRWMSPPYSDDRRSSSPHRRSSTIATSATPHRPWTVNVPPACGRQHTPCVTAVEQGSSSVALVTGATGFIGRALLARLVADGRRVVATSRHPHEPDPDVEWRAGAVADQEFVERLVEEVRPATVFHL